LPRAAASFTFDWPAGRKTLLRFVPWKGIYPAAMAGRRELLSLAGIVFPVPDWSMKRKGSVDVAGKVTKHLAPVESDFFARLLGLVEHCAITQYDDGERRQPGWIMLKTLGSAWQIEAKDPDSGNKLPVTAATLDDALILMDALLRAEDAPWEPDAFLMARKAGKKK
jgi:hypothetical protein